MRPKRLVDRRSIWGEMATSIEGCDQALKSANARSRQYINLTLGGGRVNQRHGEFREAPCDQS
jgi:hypothetical protein